MQKRFLSWSRDKKGIVRKYVCHEYSNCLTPFGMIDGAMTTSILLIEYDFMDTKQKLHFRIRKLTPRECFRLMDVSEDDIDKIQAAGISNSQQYKMAGNSIVVSCLVGIFRQMFMPVVYEDISETIIQTSLFDDPNFL